MKRETCHSIRQMMIDTKLSKLQRKKIQSHIDSCTECQTFHAHILHFDNFFTQNETHEIEPPPWIQARLINRLESRPKWSWFWNLKNNPGLLVNRRIPAFHIVSTVVILFAGIAVLRWLPMSGPAKPIASNSIAPIDSVLSRQLGIMPSLDMLKRQKIGCSVQEDSSVFQFVRSM